MDPVTIGSHYAQSGIDNFTARTLVAPSANVNGLVIRTCQLAGVNGNVRLHTGKVGPKDRDYGDRTITTILTVNGGSSLTTVVMPYELQIPAGYGLWSGNDQQSTGNVFLTYDLL